MSRTLPKFGSRRVPPTGVRWCWKGVVVACLALVTFAHAQTTISIANASFETPPTTGERAEFSGSDWRLGNDNADAAVTAWSSFTTAQYDSGVTAPDASQIGFINGTDSKFIYQDVGVNFVTGTTYTFSAYFGRRLDNPDATGQVKIFRTDGTELAGSGVISPTAGQSFQLGSVSYTATSEDNAIGIRVLIYNSSGTNQQINFDLAQLTSVPEPATYASILGAAALGVAALRRRRKPA